MLLNSATQKLVAVLTSAKTTYDLPITVNYANKVAAPFSFAGVPVYTYSNGLTTITLLTGVAGAELAVTKISVYGKDTAAKGFRIGVVDFTTPIVAGSFTAGRPYQITSVGTTDFTLIGAANNTPGTIFDATDVGTGTGTASPFYQELDTILQVDDTLFCSMQGWYTVDSQGNLKSVQAASATSIANAIHTAPVKTTPVGADELGIWDSVSGLLNRVSFTNALNWFAAKLGSITNTFAVAMPSASTDAARAEMVSFMPTVASATTPDIFGAAGATINYTGTVTATGLAACAASQVGSVKRIIPASGASFTASANFIIDGATSGTFLMPANAIIEILALSTTQFQVTTILATGTWTPNQGAGLTVVGTFSSSGTFTKRGKCVTISGKLVGSTSIAVAAVGIIFSNAPFAASPIAGVGGVINSAPNQSSIILLDANTSIAYSANAITATSYSLYFSITYELH